MPVLNIRFDSNTKLLRFTGDGAGSGGKKNIRCQSGLANGSGFPKEDVFPYDVHRLFASYTGPQIRVRRTSDDAEADAFFDVHGRLRKLINATNGDTIHDFDGWTDGLKVVKFYDQSRGQSISAQHRSLSSEEEIDLSIGLNGTGGDEIYDHDGYRVHVFKKSGHFHVKRGGKVDVLVVAGGGAGGSNNTGGSAGGGGGGGGILLLKSYGIGSGNIAVTVGNGGEPVEASRPSDSEASGMFGGESKFMDIVAYGGGAGAGCHNSNEPPKRSKEIGGGGGWADFYDGEDKNDIGRSGGSQGNDGAPSGEKQEPGGSDGRLAGGGGSGGHMDNFSGTDGGDGGDYTRLFGTKVGDQGVFSGGGGGGTGSSIQSPGKGGKGGGGDGSESGRGEDGTPNTGGGGGCSSASVSSTEIGGKGGSGVVIVRYPLGVNRDVGALDGLSLTGQKNPLVAFALRRLYGSYVGPQVRVRRSSDDKEANVYFDLHGRVTLIKDDDGNASTDLEEWLGGNDGLVTKWFNQAARYRRRKDVSIVDTSLQPEINALMTSTSDDRSCMFIDDFQDTSLWDFVRVSSIQGNSTSRTRKTAQSLHLAVGENVTENPVARISADRFGGNRPTKISFDWNDPDNSGSGGGMLFVDENDKVVFGHGSDNPQWDRVDGDGWHVYEAGIGSSDYNIWVHVDFTPNWEDGTYEYSITGDQGTSLSGTGPLGGASIESIVAAFWNSSDLPSDNSIPVGSKQSPSNGFHVNMHIANLMVEQPYVGALDGLGLTGQKKPVAAYALRRLFGSYAGPQVKIRRSSDDVEAEVYFDRHGRVTLVKTENGETSRTFTLDKTEYIVEKFYNQGSGGKQFDMKRYVGRRSGQQFVYIDQSDSTIVFEFSRGANDAHFGIDINRVPDTKGSNVMSCFINCQDSNNGTSFHDKITQPLAELEGSDDMREGNTRRRGTKVVHTIDIKKNRAVLAGLQYYSTSLEPAAQKMHTVVIDDDSANIASTIAGL